MLKSVTKTKKENKVMTCRYCEHWQLTKRIVGEDDKKCPFSKNNVTRESESCLKFKFTDSFWCDKRKQQKYVAACILSKGESKTNPIYKHCKNCKQGDKIKHYIDHRS